MKPLLLAVAAAVAGPAVHIADRPPQGPPIPFQIALTGDASSGKVLALWGRAEGMRSQTIARPLKLDGRPAGPVRIVRDGYGGPELPVLAWDSRRSRAMLVGLEPDPVTRTIVLVTTFVDADGNLIGPGERIPTAPGKPATSPFGYEFPSEPSVAYDPVSDTYMVAYTEGPSVNGRKQVFKLDVQRVSASGRAIGGPLRRVERRTGRMMGRIVASPRGGGFLLVYCASSVVRSKPMTADGTPTSTAGDPLVSSAGSAPTVNPRVAVDVPTGRFLVSWQQGISEGSARFILRTVGPDGRPDGDPREIKGSGVIEAAADAGSDGWLLAWRADRLRAAKVVAMRADAAGTPDGAAFAVADGGQLWDPSVIAGRPGRFLEAWSVATGYNQPWAPFARPLTGR